MRFQRPVARAAAQARSGVGRRILVGLAPVPGGREHLPSAPTTTAPMGTSKKARARRRHGLGEREPHQLVVGQRSRQASIPSARCRPGPVMGSLSRLVPSAPLPHHLSASRKACRCDRAFAARGRSRGLPSGACPHREGHRGDRDADLVEQPGARELRRQVAAADDPSFPSAASASDRGAPRRSETAVTCGAVPFGCRGA